MQKWINEYIILKDKSIFQDAGLKYCPENDKRFLIITTNALIKILYIILLLLINNNNFKTKREREKIFANNSYFILYIYIYIAYILCFS